MRAIAISLALSLLSACGSDDDGCDDPKDQSWMTLTGAQFVPACVRVPPGTPMTFTNRDTAPHTVVATGAAAFESPSLATGTTFEFTLNNPGTVKLSTRGNSGIRGTIVVE